MKNFIALIAFLAIPTSVYAQYFLPEPQGTPTKYPIVLAHGFNASPDSMWGFNPEMIDALKSDGHEVHVTQVSPFNSAAVRASELKSQIDPILASSGSDKVHIIAHSMGGLDARFLISRLDYANRVASLTTISTPHYGTKIADFVLEKSQSVPNAPISVFTNMVGQQEHGACREINCNLRAAFNDMREDADNGNTTFNRATPNIDGVLYQSWAGVSYPATILNLGGQLTSDKKAKVLTECTKEGGQMLMGNDINDSLDIRLELIANIVSHGHGDDAYRPNDGVVTVQSARWGVFRGCIPTDHLDEVGQVEDKNDQPNGNTDFNYIRFYRTVAFELAEKDN